ncbi:MAG: hypothetical protein EA364_05200 [Balneolaceae bacterium]|nr:MAG: hypothetical protein EA364_05200 [Balneolaceae bacterium]
MDKFASIEIRVKGKIGQLDLSPDNYDVKEIGSMLKNIEDLLYPTNKKDRSIITYNIEEGSVRHIFKTSIQAVIGFSAVLIQIQKANSIDFLELKTAQAIENIQQVSYQKNYEFELYTSINDDANLIISPDSQFVRTDNIMVDAELYFYGTLTNAGGKNKANIHIDTEEYGSLTIDTDKEFIREREENFLYKKFGVRAVGKQNIETGEFDKGSLTLLELIDYSPKFDESYLNTLIQKAKSSWRDVNPDLWLGELRGDYEA